MRHDIYATLGASNHSNDERDLNDYYATDPKALELLLDEYGDEIALGNCVWEPAAGGGHLSKALRKRGCYVYSTDVADHGYRYDQLIDFFAVDEANRADRDVAKCLDSVWLMDIVTNPPYKFATEFIEHALDLLRPECKALMFLKLSFLEGQKRKELFEKYPPKAIYVSSSRLQCGKGGVFKQRAGETAIAYAWFLWEKGYNGATELKWFN